MNKQTSPRLPDFDYSSAGVYFVTFCVQNRRPLLWIGTPVNGVTPDTIALSETGRMVDAAIQNIPRVYPHVSVDTYCIMPDHVHLLLRFSPAMEDEMTGAPSVSRIIKQLKVAVTKQLGQSIWQKSFYDHIIRDEQDYQNIDDYIQRNPAKWFTDRR